MFTAGNKDTSDLHKGHSDQQYHRSVEFTTYSPLHSGGR